MSDHDLVLERVLDAPRDLVWEAWTTPEHIRRWWAPRPYETPEVEIDLKPGGIFRMRMTGPDGFDTGTGGAGCVLDVVERERVVWTSALGPGWRPNAPGPADCGGFLFTAIMTFEDAPGGKTLYRAIAKHKDGQDAETHAKMGFHEGWGTCADQLGEVAAGLAADA
ncbi:MAG TPA: SRPBCC family protein [Allosphingosinicella sp.]|nr:SRPBCC family protein [Allosphingosinicella sp.]